MLPRRFQNEQRTIRPSSQLRSRYEQARHGLKCAANDLIHYNMKKLAFHKTPKFSARQVRKLRKTSGYSVSSLAVACGVSPRTVEGWEGGRPISLGCRFILREISAANTRDDQRRGE